MNRDRYTLATSHPVRVRGLKHNFSYFNISDILSHPVRVRGLKHRRNQHTALGYAVAPHAGAWIETKPDIEKRNHPGVAPHAGAWIETNRDCPKAQQRLSHPMRVRGLKPLCEPPLLSY